MVQNDWGVKYMLSFVEFCTEHRIRYETNTSYTLQQNGVAGKKIIL